MLRHHTRKHYPSITISAATGIKASQIDNSLFLFIFLIILSGLSLQYR
jgi:hypothetical protein